MFSFCFIFGSFCQAKCAISVRRTTPSLATPDRGTKWTRDGIAGRGGATQELAGVRILDACTGAVLRDVDTNRAYTAVNGVAGHGGSMRGGSARSGSTAR